MGIVRSIKQFDVASDGVVETRRYLQNIEVIGAVLDAFWDMVEGKLRHVKMRNIL